MSLELNIFVYPGIEKSGVEESAEVNGSHVMEGPKKLTWSSKRTLSEINSDSEDICQPQF